APRGNSDELRVRQMGEIAVVADYWEIRAPRDVLRVFFFLNTVSGHAHDVIVLKRQLNGLIQCDLAWRRRLPFLRGQQPGVEQQQHNAKKCSASHHGFVLSFAEVSPSGKPSSP